MKYLSILFLLFAISTVSQAEDHAHDHSSHDEFDIRLLQTFEVGSNQFVYLSVRDHGHVLGQKFIVETRVSCQGHVDNIKELEVVDSYSVCNMKPDSVVKNTKGTAVAMLAKSADINRYYEELANGVPSPEIHCNQSNEVLKFSLKNRCK
jgi:hypothetical protein